MKEYEHKYSDLIRQQVNCKGKIRNYIDGIEITLDTKDYVTKEEFLLNFLNKFSGTYDMNCTMYNRKEYRKMLKGKIDQLESDLEKMKFAHKICNKKILEIGNREDFIKVVYLEEA